MCNELRRLSIQHPCCPAYNLSIIGKRAGGGAARAELEPKIGSVIGKALEDFDGTNGVIEIAVGRV